MDSVIWAYYFTIVSTDFGARSHLSSLSNFTYVFLDTLEFVCAHKLSCLFTYCSLPLLGQVDMMSFTTSLNF